MSLLKKKKKNFALLDKHKTRLGIHFFFSMFLFLFFIEWIKLVVWSWRKWYEPLYTQCHIVCDSQPIG